MGRSAYGTRRAIGRFPAWADSARSTVRRSILPGRRSSPPAPTERRGSSMLVTGVFWVSSLRDPAATRSQAPRSARTDKLIVTTAADGYIRVWDARTYRQLVQIRPASSVGCAVQSRQLKDRDAGSSGTAQIWDARTGKPILPSPTPRPRLLSASFSPDGTQVITAGLDGTAADLGRCHGKTGLCTERGEWAIHGLGRCIQSERYADRNGQR